jgi:hypothetical protein
MPPKAKAGNSVASAAKKKVDKATITISLLNIVGESGFEQKDCNQESFDRCSLYGI